MCVYRIDPVPPVHLTPTYITQIAHARALAHDRRLISAGQDASDESGDITVPQLAQRRGFHCVNEGATLDEVADILVRNRCHRVPVVRIPTTVCSTLMRLDDVLLAVSTI